MCQAVRAPCGADCLNSTQAGALPLRPLGYGEAVLRTWWTDAVGARLPIIQAPLGGGPGLRR